MKALKIITIIVLGFLATPILILSWFQPVRMNFGLGKVGYYDNKGAWMAKYEMDGPYIDVGAGASPKYLGGVAKVTALNLNGKARIFDIEGKRFFVGAGIDVGSIGGGLEFDMKKGEIRLGASAIIGGSVNLSWEEIYQEEERQ